MRILRVQKGGSKGAEVQPLGVQKCVRPSCGLTSSNDGLSFLSSGMSNPRISKQAGGTVASCKVHLCLRVYDN